MVLLYSSGCEPSPPPQYKVGDVLQLKLTGEKVVVIGPIYSNGMYRCKTSTSEDSQYMYKQVFLHEAELEPVRERAP